MNQLPWHKGALLTEAYQCQVKVSKIIYLYLSWNLDQLIPNKNTTAYGRHFIILIKVTILDSNAYKNDNSDDYEDDFEQSPANKIDIK